MSLQLFISASHHLRIICVIYVTLIDVMQHHFEPQVSMTNQDELSKKNLGYLGLGFVGQLKYVVKIVKSFYLFIAILCTKI